MLILDRDGVRIGNGWADHTAGQTPVTIDLPADLVLRDSAVIDRLIDAVFDRLWNGTIDLRVRVPPPTAGTSGHAGTTGIRT